MIWSSLVQPQDQIYYKPLDHEDWKQVLSRYELVTLGSDEQMTKSFTHFSEHMHIELISESRGQLYNKEYKQKVMQVAFSAFYQVKK